MKNKAYGFINKEVKAGGKKAYELAGEALPLEYIKGYDDHL